MNSGSLLLLLLSSLFSCWGIHAIYIFTYLDLPKLCVKYVPKFTKQNLPKGRIFTYLEDPGT